MKKLVVLLFVFFMLKFTMIYAEEFLPKITTVNDIITKMVEKFNGIRTYRAKFKIKKEIEGKVSWTKGEIKYKVPDTFIMLFSVPQDQIIYSDGKKLKIYIPQLKVVAEQRLEKYRSSFFIAGKTSLYYLRNKYNIAFEKSNKPIMIGNTPVYVLLCTQKETVAGFKTIRLFVSQYWLIIKAEGITLSGNKVTISFYNIRLNTKITEHEFEFTLPVNTQTIIDPLSNK